MDIKGITILWVLTFVSALTPSVHENVEEYAEETALRNLKNPLDKFNVPADARNVSAGTLNVYKPPKFDFQNASQQDRLKFRYAQQQQMDFDRIAKLRKRVSSSVPSLPTYESYRGRRDVKAFTKESSQNDWKPFEPRMIRRGNNGKIYLKRENRMTAKGLDRQDTFPQNTFSQVVFVHPSLLREEYDTNYQSGVTFTGKQTDNELNALNDLLGKNPNVQLEGLKRLLQQPVSDNHIVPTIKNPAPFEIKEQIPINDKDSNDIDSKSNDKLSYQDVISGVIPKTPISQEDLVKLQKELDEASQRQVQEALARAQQEALAHVEAQQKALEQTQKVLIENAQKSLYDNPSALPIIDVPQALPLIQPPQSRPLIQPPQIYSTPASSMTPIIKTVPSSSMPLYHKYVPKDISITNSPIVTTPRNFIVVKDRNKVNPTANAIAYTKIPHPVPTRPSYNIKNVPSTPRVPIVVSTTVAPRETQTSFRPTSPTTSVPTIIVPTVTSPPVFKVSPINPLKAAIISKNVKYYAPNHLHESIFQKQAEKAIIAQVMSSNKAILKKKKNYNMRPETPTKYYYKQEEESGEDEEEGRGDQPAAATYHRHVVYDQPSEEKNVYASETDDEEGAGDELQYAAKYAFGYQIRDHEEGSDYGHQEKRNGRSAKGSYHVLLPDGRKQKVEYYADDTGYHAKVTYENFAQHD